MHAEVRPHLAHGTLARSNVDGYAARLASVIPDLMPPAPTEEEPVTANDVDWMHLPDDKLLEVLPHVSIARSRSLRRHVWLLGGAGPVNNNLADLESRIRRKEADLPRYQEHFDACWLLMYAMPQASAFFDFEVLHEGILRSSFDGVAFLEVFTGKSVVIARR